MKRMTFNENGKWYIRAGNTVISGPVADRLAAYEDTGIEPQEIMSLLHHDNTACFADELLFSTATPKPRLSEIRSRNVNTLPLSKRAYTCIRRAPGLPRNATIGELADMHADDIYWIRHCGKITREEIARALQSVGIEKSDWFSFLPSGEKL